MAPGRHSTADGSAHAAPETEVRDFFIFMSVVGVGVWYLHTHPLRTQSPPETSEVGGGEIVVAKAPDGSLVGRWPSPTPTTHAGSQR